MGTPLGVFSRGKGWEMIVVICFSPYQVSHTGREAAGIRSAWPVNRGDEEALRHPLGEGRQTMLRVTGKGGCGTGPSGPRQSTAYLASIFLCWTLSSCSDLTALE